MVDRVSPSYGKVPDFSTKKEHDRVIGQIQLMEPSTAYVAVQGIVVPTLNVLHNNRPLQNAILPPPPMYAPSKLSTSSISIYEIERCDRQLQEIQKNFANIQKQLTDLYANRQEIIDRWLDSTTANPIQPDNQAFQNFYYSREKIEMDLLRVESGIEYLENKMPASSEKTNLVQQLRKIHSDLVSKIPEPGSTSLSSFNEDEDAWKITGDVNVNIKDYNGNLTRFYWENSTGEIVKIRWGRSKYGFTPNNPLGIFEVVIDANRSRYNDLLTTLSEGGKSVSEFYKTNAAKIFVDIRAEKSYQILGNLHQRFVTIQKQLIDLYANRQEIIDQWAASKSDNPIRPDNQILKDFYYLRKNIEENLNQIKFGIMNFEDRMPPSKDKENLIQQLQKIHSDLLSKIPEPRYFAKGSGLWLPSFNILVDIKKDSSKSFYWKEHASEEAKVMKWSDSGDDKLPNNPLGIFEMTINADRSKYDDFLTTLSEGRKSINKFYRTDGARTLHPFALRDLDTQSAYMYLITVYLPFLQNESAQTLEKQGETMKQIAKAYDKWSEIQSEINGLVEIMQTLKKKGLIDQSGKLDVTRVDVRNSSETGRPVAVIHIKDTDRSFQPLIDKSKAIKVKIGEMQSLLNDLEKKLPPSQQSLIATLKETTSRLMLKRDAEYSFYYQTGESELRFEMENKFVKITDVKDVEYVRKFIFSTMQEEYFFIADEDQTKFKAYTDNIAQGITALTSVSNMTQQELQLSTQYYNSLLALQKSGLDSLNKTMQTILNNIR